MMGSGLFALALLATCPQHDDTTNAVCALADAYHAQGRFQGSVLVARGDEVLLRKGYGLANAEHGIENTPATRFRLASVTKQWTAAAALLLVERGELELDAPVGNWVPGLPPRIGAVTIVQLLSHSGGIIRDLEALSPKGMGDAFTMPEMIDIIGGSSLDFASGETWAYSNAGFVLASAAIEGATGRAYGQAMRALLFDPLGLDDTAHEITGLIVLNRAHGYEALPDGLMNAPFENKSYVTGAGSLYSTVNDLWTWLYALRTGEVLSKNSLDRLFSRQAGQYGLGWFVGDRIGPFREHREERGRVVHHGGGCPGFSTDVLLYLDHEITVVALSNAQPSESGVMSVALADLVLGLDVHAPTIDPSREVCRLAILEDLGAARERWDELRAAGGGPATLPSSSTIDSAGHRYLAAGRPRKAMRLFELNVDVFPADAGAWESLGDAHLAIGDRAEAIELYEMSFSLNAQDAVRLKLENLGGR